MEVTNSSGIIVSTESSANFTVFNDGTFSTNLIFNDFIEQENRTKSIFKNIKDFAKDLADEIKNDPNQGYLLLSIAVALFWAIFIILYHSRLLGCIASTILRRFIIHGEFQIGSISICPLWGKLMIRHLVYITEDFSIRVVDAVIQFHYWLPYQRKKLTDDMSKSDHRLWIQLNGPEIHIYNRSELYSRLEEIFGLDPQLIPPKSHKRQSFDAQNDLLRTTKKQLTKNVEFWIAWRDLVPVIKFQLNMARFVFGNQLIPSTLILTMDKCESVYSTKAAQSQLDFFMHVVKAKAENFRVILAPSPKYTGSLDEPPRFMGEGFVVLSVSKVSFYHYMDEAGTVPESNPDLLIEQDVEEYADTTAPAWGLDVKCEKGTSISYGPWADRQREQLFKLFFPQDYRKTSVEKAAIPGTVRQANQFDIRLSILSEATIDILFSKENETNAVHMTAQKGSSFELTVPWVVKSEDYTVRIIGQFLYLDASTSLQYRSLLEAEFFKYEINVKYPLLWNKLQNWELNFFGSKTTYHFLYAHKFFFQDLIEDWSSKSRPDLLHFVPYICHFHFAFKKFELITLANEYNWVDCSSQKQLNAHVGFCGESVELKFKLHFDTFLPPTLPLKFLIKGKTLYLSLFIPEADTTRNIIAALEQNSKLQHDVEDFFAKSTWRKFCKASAGWIDCWEAPEIDIVIGYTYHPFVPMGPSPQANVSTPEKIETLLSAVRAPKKRLSSPNVKNKKPDFENVDRSSMEPDQLSLDLRIIQPSDLKLYGCILHYFLNLKENIFGDNQKFFDMDSPSSFGSIEDPNCRAEVADYLEREVEDDERKYRPMQATIRVDIRKVRGHLIKECTEKDPPCPVVMMDRLIFEMDKRHEETRMQVVLSPIILSAVDPKFDAQADSGLRNGFILLSAFQMRGHAMFSDRDLLPSEETLEYSWLVEFTVGSITGRLTPVQLSEVISGLEAFTFTAFNTENSFRHPKPFIDCYHGSSQPHCSHTLDDVFCPSIDFVKYKMIRASVDSVDLHLIETGTDFNLQIYPIRLSWCNQHGQQLISGITALIQNIYLKNFIHVPDQGLKHSGQSSSLYTDSEATEKIYGSDKFLAHNKETQYNRYVPCEEPIWVEVSAVNFGPVFIDCNINSNIHHKNLSQIQYKFLKLHDEKFKKLWFIWRREDTKSDKVVKCGCLGGCNFFGFNLNGPSFFKPSKQDIIQGLSTAHYRLNEELEAPGYGQSIIKAGQFVFNPRPYSVFSCRRSDSEKIRTSGSFKRCYKTHQFSNNFNGKLKEKSHTINSTFDMDRLKNSSHTLPSHFKGDKQVKSNSGIKNKSKIYSPSKEKVGLSSSLGRPRTKELVCGSAEARKTPRSLFDLVEKQPSPLASRVSLQVTSATKKIEKQASLEKSDSFHSIRNSGANSNGSPIDNGSSGFQTASLTSEIQAFYSAKEEIESRVCTLSSPQESPQCSLHEVTEFGNADSKSLKSGSISSGPLQSEFVNETSYVTGTGSALSPSDSLPPINTHRESTQSLNVESDENSSICDHSSEGETKCGNISDMSKGCSQRSLLHSSSSEDQDKTKQDKRSRRKYKFKSREILTSDEEDVYSLSSNTFMSAISSQDDIALVDLHIQLNKPIIESPLLMSAYVNHLSQVWCSNWDHVVPKFDDGKKSSEPQCYMPSFEKIKDGFTDMYDVSISNDQRRRYSSGSAYAESSNFVFINNFEDDSSCEKDVEAIVLNSNTSRMTIVIKLKGEINVTVSPIILETLTIFVQAVTPVFEKLHSFTIINRAHFRSVSKVESKNKLKKDKFMQWSKVRTLTLTRDSNLSPIVTSTYQKTCFQQVQGQLFIPRINVTMLQASVVEEVIAFSALDNIKDITCVSLFAVSLDSVSINFYSGHQCKQAVQMFRRNNKLLGKPKKAKAKAKHNLDLYAEPVYIETSEKEQEENLVSLDISKLHVQLRRLKNESSLLEDASITAIPNYRSKVMFALGIDTNKMEPESHSDTLKPEFCSLKSEEQKMGFIMFESGLENVSLKAVKRCGFGPQNSSVEKSSECDYVSDPPESHKEDERQLPDMEENKFAQKFRASFKKCKNQSPAAPPRKPSRSSSVSVPIDHSNLADIKEDVENLEDDENESDLSKLSRETDGLKKMKNEVSSEQIHGDASNIKKDISSLVIELSTAWLSFAAPPRAPITKKIDYTRLDWNFLSTVSPSINAWLNPIDRFTVALNSFNLLSESRRLSVIAALMAEALEDPSVHNAPKNNGKLTPLSQAIQEDPSCQLCNALRRYLLKKSVKHVEENFTHSVPKLTTLRQGIVALSRQWKSALYMPLLMEQTFKTRQGIAPEKLRNRFRRTESKQNNGKNETLNPKDHLESINEETNDDEKERAEDKLGSSSHHSNSALGKTPKISSVDQPNTSKASHSITQRPPRPPLPRSIPHSSISVSPSRVNRTPPVSRKYFWSNIATGIQETRQTVMKRVIVARETLFRNQVRSQNKKVNLPADNLEVCSNKRLSDSDEVDEQERRSLIVQEHTHIEEEAIPEPSEDFYIWMAKQQEHNHKNSRLSKQTVSFNNKGPDLSEMSDCASEIDPNEINNLKNFSLDQSNLKSFGDSKSNNFLEAHVIFEPLLSSIGLITQQITDGALEQLGANVSVVGNIETFRMDIIESEEFRTKLQSRKISNTPKKVHIDVISDVPSFICEKLTLEIDIRKAADNSKGWCRQPTLFVSRSALKRHTSTILNISLDISYIAQQVNMPLLRLIHQITWMYKNAIETKMSLREQRSKTKGFIPSNKDSDSCKESTHSYDYGGIKLERSRKESEEISDVNAEVFVKSRHSSKSLPEEIPLIATSKSNTEMPKCWRNIYYLVDLYATTPATKTVIQRKLSQTDEDHSNSNSIDVEAGISRKPSFLAPHSYESSILAAKSKDTFGIHFDKTPLVIFGVAKINKTKLLASLSGLKLEAEIAGMHSSVTFREKIKGGSVRSTSEMSVNGQVGSSMIVLLEGIAPNQQTVVQITVSKSQGLYSSLSRMSKNKNSALITIGPIEIDIPQHPIILHDMMTRGTKQLSSTLQEFRVSRPSRLSRGTTVDEADIISSPRPSHPKTPEHEESLAPYHSILHPLTIQFSILLQNLSVHAALLPSLEATYCMQEVTTVGYTGFKMNFKIHLPTHHLSFTTKLSEKASESTLPPSAKISLPEVHVEAQYMHDERSERSNENATTEGMILTEGSYLNAVAEIGSLEHSLTTDLLNHLVFVQKVFMKEVNEVVQKMAGSDRPFSLLKTDSEARSSQIQTFILYNIQIKLKGIIITATTPTQSAVRLETGTFELQLSNRVENVSKRTKVSMNANQHSKLFGKAEVDVSLALGQLIINDLFDEVEPHFQQLAYFRTRIGLRNAFHEEVSNEGEEGEMVLITLTRPLICIQPAAIDKAVLVWLNYKNAYEYWSEQRASLNKEVLTATQQVFERVPQFSAIPSAAQSIKNNLFLKLTVVDIGICLPVSQCRTISHQVDSTETKDALVVTLERTIISACNSGSLVCKAEFKDFCVRFAPDFETSLDEWKPDYRDRFIMNLCKVSDGTYEVCSRALVHSRNREENAKWLLNVKWQMEGVEMHLDVNIGRHLSSLARTLTMLSGAQYAATEVPSSTNIDSDDPDSNDTTPQGSASLPAFIFDTHMDPKKRAKLLEIEMNEQAKTVNDLKILGASAQTIGQEVRRLKELEHIVSNDFRRDMLMKIRRQSIKATSMKDRLGLGQKLHTSRSKSFRVPSPTVELREPIHSFIASDTTISSAESNSGDEFDLNSDVFVESLPSFRSPYDENSENRKNFDEALEESSNFDENFEDRRYLDKNFEKRQTSDEKTSTNRLKLMDLPAAKRNILPQKSSKSNYVAGTPGVSSFGATSFSSAGASQVYPTEPSIDLELDVAVCISSGQCILYNEDFELKKEKEKEEDLKSKLQKERSFSFEPPSSPNSVKKRAQMKNFPRSKFGQSSSNVAPQVTVFFIPGLDVKVHYESHDASESGSSLPVSRIGSKKTSLRSFHPQAKNYTIREDTDRNKTESEMGSKDMGMEASSFPENSRLETDDLSQYEKVEYRKKRSKLKTLKSPSFTRIFSEEKEKVDDMKDYPNYGGKSKLLVNFFDDYHKKSTEGSETEFQSSDYMKNYGPSPSLLSHKRPPMKRASLFTWLTLQSIAETVISPCILDFLDKVLEPISHLDAFKPDFNSPVSTEPDYTYGDESDGFTPNTSISATGYTYASFPVDVVVYFHMKPSSIRFSSQPVSRVECLLKLPSLDLVLSSKRSDESSQGLGAKESSSMGGLSVAGALEDFSLFIFHPYGSKHPSSASIPCNPMNENERKDFLSVVVEFVKIHISRSRKIDVVKPESNINTKKEKKSSTFLETPKAIIRFSTIVDIGAALFKYDMRHITEILAFPKAWYRRALVRRLFLGDVTSRLKKSEVETDTKQFSLKKQCPTCLNNASECRRSNCGGAAATTPTSTKNEPTPWKKERSRTITENNLKAKSTDQKYEGDVSWETLVQFSVNFTKLKVHMNMRNVMGQSEWTTKDFKSNGRLSIGSCGHKNLYLSFALGGSTLEAKGGIVGGLIELTDINMYVRIREDPHTEPDHVLGVKLFASQSRLDYMGTSVLFGRVSKFGLNLKDEWKFSKLRDSDATKRSATIFLLGDVEWDQLQLLINKSTTADLFKMYTRLQEFFQQQFKSSKLVFSALSTDAAATNSNLKPKEIVDSQKQFNQNGSPECRHHRHWQKVLSKILDLKLPSNGTIVGGSLELHGKSILLACFHGLNFKSKSWAVFSLSDPYINFTSEAQDVPGQEGESGNSTHVAQNFTLSLGVLEQTHAQHVSMAKVCRITRNMVFPPQFRTMQEWFHYALCCSELDDVNRFPSVEPQNGSLTSNTSEGKRPTSRVIQDFKHTSETIFAFPSFELHINTKQLQGYKVPDITDQKPVVECSLVTEFQDHIFVTVDAELFFFLHDLIISYIKDTKEKIPMESDKKEGDKKPKVNEPTQILQQDWREFHCSTWHLEPTVRLLSWAARNLEPYGVELILNKLGFSQAKTTIPKWLQRGCMDPLDAVLSVLLSHLIAAINEHGSIRPTKE